MSPAGPPPGPLLVDSHVTRTRHAGLRAVTTCHYFSASSRWAPGTPGFDQSRIAASAPRDPDHDLETAKHIAALAPPLLLYPQRTVSPLLPKNTASRLPLHSVLLATPKNCEQRPIQAHSSSPMNSQWSTRPACSLQRSSYDSMILHEQPFNLSNISMPNLY